MDACDPGLDIGNLRTLIKQNVGVDLKLSKNQICDVYSSIQDGKLPLPPLVLSKDGSYLIDAKSPLTRKEFETLFKSTSRVDEIRRIAKKVGIVRYANKKITKQQLIDIIGRRLHSINVHEPIKLRSVQKKQIEKNAFNNNANLVNNLNVNRVNNNLNNINRLNNNVNNVNRLNNNVNRVNNSVNRVNNSVNNVKRVNNSVNNVKRVNNSVNRVNNLSSKIKKNEKPRFLNRFKVKTSTNTLPKPYKAFTSKKPNKPSFLNKSFIATSKIKPQNGYVFKKGNKGLGMYKNNKVVEGPVQGPPRGPIDGPDIIKQRNTEIKENEILLKSYLNRENVSKYINNSEKGNAQNRIKRGVKFNNVKTYINGIVSTKITNAQRIENQKLKLEQNRNELQKILSELTNLTNTNKNEILSKFNSNGKLNNAKTLAIQKNRNIKKAKLGNLKLNLETFLKNKNINNKRTYINRLNAGEDISNLKREILGVINKKNTNRKNYDLKLKELMILLDNSKNLNNSMKSKFLQNFENTRNFNKVKKNIEDEFKKINNARKATKNEQQRLLSKILNNSKNLTNANKVAFLKRFNNGENFNTVKNNAIIKAQELAKIRKNKNEENRLAREKNEENRLAKEEANRKAKEEANLKNKQQILLSKILNNSKNLTNANKVSFLKRFNNGENFNTVKNNAIRKSQELAKVRKNKNEENRLAREKNEENRLAKEEENRKAKEEANRLAKENNNRKAKEEANRKAKEEANLKNKQQKLLSKILNNSRNMTNANKVAFLKRFNNGENFNTVKTNAIKKAQELAIKRERNEQENSKNAWKKAQEQKKKEEANLKNKQQKLLSKILNNSKNLTNANKMAFLKRFNNGENFNTVKTNAIKKAQELAKVRKNKNEENRLAREKNEENRIAKEEKNRKEKEEVNRKAKEEANRKAKEQKLLSKILNNSKNLTNTNKVSFLKRYEKGENFNTVKKNAINKAKELANQRKKKEEEEKKAREKEEANRKAKEDMIEKKKAEALAKKKKEDEEKKKKEAENKKKAAQNQQLRASLTKKVKSTQMDQKVKNKLLNQLKNYSIQIKNVAPSIEQTINSEKLNGNYNEAANIKKRQEVKKQLAAYIAKTYPNMSKTERGKYIQRANLTQWRKGFLTGSQGMGANQALERIKGNIERNMKAKKPPPPPLPQKNKKANLKKLVNNTMGGRAAKNVSRLKKNINEGVSEMAVKTRLAQLNKQTKYQK